MTNALCDARHLQFCQQRQRNRSAAAAAAQLLVEQANAAAQKKARFRLPSIQVIRNEFCTESKRLLRQQGRRSVEWQRTEVSMRRIGQPFALIIRKPFRNRNANRMSQPDDSLSASQLRAKVRRNMISSSLRQHCHDFAADPLTLQHAVGGNQNPYSGTPPPPPSVLRFDFDTIHLTSRRRRIFLSSFDRRRCVASAFVSHA